MCSALHQVTGLPAAVRAPRGGVHPQFQCFSTSGVHYTTEATDSSICAMPTMRLGEAIGRVCVSSLWFDCMAPVAAFTAASRHHSSAHTLSLIITDDVHWVRELSMSEASQQHSDRVASATTGAVMLPALARCRTLFANYQCRNTTHPLEKNQNFNSMPMMGFYNSPWAGLPPYCVMAAVEQALYHTADGVITISDDDAYGVKFLLEQPWLGLPCLLRSGVDNDHRSMPSTGEQS